MSETTSSSTATSQWAVLDDGWVAARGLNEYETIFRCSDERNATHAAKILNNRHEDQKRLTAECNRYREALERIAARAVENERMFVPCSGLYRSIARTALDGEQ